MLSFPYRSHQVLIITIFFNLPIVSGWLLLVGPLVFFFFFLSPAFRFPSNDLCSFFYGSCDFRCLLKTFPKTAIRSRISFSPPRLFETFPPLVPHKIPPDRAVS